MIKKSFFGMAKPGLKYEALETVLPKPENISVSKNITLFIKSSDKPNTLQSELLIKKGDKVKTGQKLLLSKKSSEYAISSVTGTVLSIEPFTGNYGQNLTAVTIEKGDKEEIDESFGNISEKKCIDIANDFLSHIPGNPNFNLFLNSEKPINKIVVCAMDQDMLVTTNQHVLKTDVNDIKTGLDILKTISKTDDVVIVSPRHLIHDASALDAAIKIADLSYPSALPKMIMKDLLDNQVPAGQNCEDLGVCFMSVEAVSSIGKAFQNKRIPFTKTLTVIKKDGAKATVSALIGTPVSDIFNALSISIKNGDRIVFGGPLTGYAVYSEDYPVQPDTDAIIVQDSEDISYVSDYPCINCGECIRICPAKIPVNMLVRFLEAGIYDEAANSYDLYSCIDCGLCSYVCVARIPIFQYIKLAKFELDKMESEQKSSVEEKNA